MTDSLLAKQTLLLCECKMCFDPFNEFPAARQLFEANLIARDFK